MVPTKVNPPGQEEWISLIGKLMVNMGTIEEITRRGVLALGDEGRELHGQPLRTRLKFLRSRCARHVPTAELAQEFEVADELAQFRNSVAHGAMLQGEGSDGSVVLAGILDFEAKEPEKGELISIEELRHRVNLAVAVAQAIGGHVARLVKVVGVSDSWAQGGGAPPSVSRAPAE